MSPSLFDKFRHRLYTVVEVQSDTEDDYGSDTTCASDEDLETPKIENHKMTFRKRSSSAITALNCLFFGLSLWMWTMTFIQKRGHNAVELERNYWLKMTSEPSPILEKIDITMQTRRMNGTFLEEKPASIFRQSPSPEVDAAWSRIETQRPIAITRQDVLSQGKDPARAAKWPESFGFGPDAFIGRIDVFHQIHCLNRLRMHLHGNYDYYYANKKENDRYHDLHVTHCVYMLLQNLMCTANVDVYTHTWLDAQQNAYPDFSINHKCRNFDTVLEWHDKHSVPLEEFGALTMPEGFQPHIMSHEFKEVFQWYDNHPDDGDFGKEVL